MKALKSLILLSFITLFFACSKSEDILPADTPVITSIQPKDPRPGDVVTISGTGFGSALADIKLTIGATTVTVTSVANTEIKFSLPAGLTEGALALLVKAAQAKIADPQGATIKPQPAVVTTPVFTALSPAAGKAGDVITLTGTNFSTTAALNTVKFAGTAATVKTATATGLTVEVPAGAATGTVSVTVNGVNAALSAGFTGAFTVTPASGGTTGTSGQTTTLNNSRILTQGLAVDAAGNVYVLGSASLGALPKLLRVSGDGSVVKSFEASEFGYKDSDFMSAVGVGTDKNGVVYVITVAALTGESKVWKINAPNAAPVMSRIATGYNFSSSVTNRNLVASSTGELYFCDATTSVHKIDLAGKVDTYLFSVSDRNDFDAVNKPFVQDISMDQNDNLYVSAESQNAVFKGLYKFTPGKVKSVLYSSSVNAYKDGPIAQATFKSLTSISVSPDGTLIFIGDVNGFYISKMDLGAGQVTKVAGNGTSDFATPTVGDNLVVRVNPVRISYDYRNQVVYSLFQRIKL